MAYIIAAISFCRNITDLVYLPEQESSESVLSINSKASAESEDFAGGFIIYGDYLINWRTISLLTSTHV